MTRPSLPATPDPADYTTIHTDIVALLDTARRAAARSVNAVMTATYWAIGQRIVAFEQAGQERAAYGEALVERLSADLTARFGRGFSKQNLWQMRAFHLAWPARHRPQTPSARSSVPLILQTPSGQSPDLSAQPFPLPWSAYVRLLSVKSPLARAFYETEALRAGWTIAQLNRQIGSQFYERTALSRNKAAMLEKGGKGASEAHYALDGLRNTVLAAEYQTVLPDEQLLANEMDKTQRELQARRTIQRADGQSSD